MHAFPHLAGPLARLVEDILDPNRNVDPAFRLTAVTLKNGETKSGLNHREEGDRVLLTGACRTVIEGRFLL